MTDERALCATEIRWTGDLWFSTNPADRDEAKRICARCPIRLGCAEAGLANPQTRGVWGGLSTRDRANRRGQTVDGADPDNEGDDEPLRRQACGTNGAFIVHRQRDEDCPKCEAAHAERLEAKRLIRLEEEHAKGGTATGAAIHRRMGELPCLECGQAEIVDRRDAKARWRAEGRRAWAQRGGAGGGAADAQAATEQAA